MKISVVIPNHNRPALLLDALQSVRTQRHAHLEIIVVDDGSEVPTQLSDDCAGDKMIRLLRNERAEGPSSAKNRGIAASSGDVITFLDDDDLMAPQLVDAVVGALTSQAQLDAVFINIDPFGTAANGMRENQAKALAALLQRAGLSGLSRQWPELLMLGPTLFEAMLRGLPLAFQRVAIRREALGRVGTYREGRFDNLDWNYRVALRCRSALLTTPLYRVRCEGQSFFTNARAEGRRAEAVIRVHEYLATLPEVEGSGRLLTAVRSALGAARFDKAYLAYTAQAPFPWLEFFRSTSSGVGWRHLSLLGKTSLRRFWR